MPEPVEPPEALDNSTADDGAHGPKRRGRARRTSTVGRVVLISTLALALVTGLGVVYFYRHLNGNLTVLDTDSQLSNRPDKARAEGPQEPLNILVMGSDDRDASGNNIDNQELGSNDRSDTTILMHLSADRERAYGVSIPRDSIIDRPGCKDEDGKQVPGATDVMWNEAFALGGPGCTQQQFEQLTGVFIDHIVVVDFAGFEDMVDAIDGVPVCIPEDIVDPAHGINIPAGTREIEGREALNYVRARYTLGDGSDISRIKRQQAFIAAMAKKVISKDTLARVDRLVGFLNAATQSLTVDEDLENVVKIAKIGVSFQDIGLDKIQFLTVPNAYFPEESDFWGRVYWKDSATRLWEQIANDEPLSKSFTGDAISAGSVPGQGKQKKPKTPEQIAAAAERAEQDGLCA
jgi:LCP family protein required for cell wall assembly